MSGGEVKWILDADSGRFDAAMDSASKKTKNLEKDIKQVDSNVSSFGSNLGSAFGGIASGLGGLLSAFTKVGLVGSIGFGAATVAAFNQVKQVQNASFALKAYETDASKVNAVLSELVGYARSDLGVLFQRQDLFDAASTLKIYGVETNKLVGYTKILSKGVAIGKTSFQELSEVLGRVVTEGKLTSDSFDVLARRGIKLPSTMRNTAVSAEELFQALDKSLPDSLLEGRANTIDGAFIRLQSSFRDLGSTILGVDADTSTFIKGGLGDLFVKSLENVRQILKDPVFKKALTDLGKSVGEFATKAIPAILNGVKFIAQNFKTVVAVFSSLTVAFIAAKVAAIGFSIATAGVALVPLLIAAAIVALIAGLTFLEIRFGFLSKAVDFLKEKLQPLVVLFQTYIMPTLTTLAGIIRDQLIAAWNNVSASVTTFWNSLQPIMPQLINIAKVIGVIVVATLVGFIVVLGAVIAIGARLIGWLISASAYFWSFVITANTAIGNFVSKVVGGLAQVIGWFNNLQNSILRAVAGFIGLLYNTGRDLIQGLINGIRDMIGAAGNAVSGAANAIKNKFKSALGINSPSKVFANYGQNIVQGLTNGIAQNASKAINVADDLSSRIVDTLSGDASYGVGINGMSIPSGSGIQNGSSMVATSGVTNHIGTITLSNDVDADLFLKKLTRQDEITATGMTSNV